MGKQDIKRTILVVDDEMEIRESLATILTACNYHVITAENGYEGLKSYKKKPADLVITDILMPRMEGIEFIHKLKTENPHQKVLVMSGGGNLKFDYLNEARLMGADVILNKPFEKDELLETIRNIFDDQHAE